MNFDEKQDAVREYIRLRLRIEAPERSRKQAELARKLGFTSAHMSNVLANNTRGVGPRLREKAAAHWGISEDRLKELAYEWHRKGRPELIEVPDENKADIYPHRIQAIEIVRNIPEIHERTIEYARKMKTRDGNDVPVDKWVEEIMDLNGRLKNGIFIPDDSLLPR